MATALAGRRPRTAPGPLYLQIADDLGARIESGDLAPHAPLPTERELAERWDVARMTVRHALDLLERHGSIYRRHGRGSFVSEPKLVQDTGRLLGFFEQTLVQGALPSSQVLHARKIQAGRSLAASLGIGVGDFAHEVVRLRSARGEPVVLETSHFPAARFPGLLERDLAHASIYRLMDEFYEGRPTSADQSLEAIPIGQYDAELLRIAVGSPVLRLERIARDRHDLIVEHAVDIYRADRARFVTHLAL